MKSPFLKIFAFMACVFSGQVSAAPVFQLGVDNNLAFQAVGIKTGAASIAVGDIFYGVVNLQDNHFWYNQLERNNVPHRMIRFRLFRNAGQQHYPKRISRLIFCAKGCCCQRSMVSCQQGI